MLIALVEYLVGFCANIHMGCYLPTLPVALPLCWFCYSSLADLTKQVRNGPLLLGIVKIL